MSEIFSPDTNGVNYRYMIELRKTVSYFILSLLSLNLQAQMVDYVLSGVIREAGKGTSVAGANVLVQSADGKKLLSYGNSGADGVYHIEYKSNEDSVLVRVTGFNVARLSRLVPVNQSKQDFDVEYADIAIKEVRVQAHPIKREGDTLSYYVSSFADKTDRSIGDVLKKLPGIEVSASGRVKYQGKEINKFYIEGLDLLGGQYGIATNNIQAADISKIEVYENHQPIKVLQDWASSDRAAINLKLKSGAKGAWNGVIQAGVGYKPILWNAELTPMFFGEKFQSIITYKTNNTGDDVSREMEARRFNAWSAEHLSEVDAPSTPPVDENLYLKNNIHAVSVNTINQLRTDSDLTFASYYIHDEQERMGNANTSYFVPGQTPFDVYENTESDSYMDKLHFALQFRDNSKSKYLKDRLSFDGAWRRGTGSVFISDTEVSEFLRQPKISFGNEFNSMRKYGQTMVHFNSLLDYDKLSTKFSVTPVSFPGLLPDGGADQYIGATRFRTRNWASASHSFGALSVGVGVGLNAHIEGFESILSSVAAPSYSSGSLVNDYLWRRFDLYVKPDLSYYKDGLSLSVVSPMELVYVNGVRHCLVRPSSLMIWTLSRDFKLDASAACNIDLGDVYDAYDGYVMRDYRTIRNSARGSMRTESQFYNLSLSYSNAAEAVFASASLGYSQTNKSKMLNNIYTPDSYLAEMVDRDNISSGISTSGRLSKRFISISTTVGLNGGWARNWSETMVDGFLSSVQMDVLRAGVKIDSKIGKFAVAEYSGDYSVRTMLGYDTCPTVKSLRQSAVLKFIAWKSFIFTLGGDHYFCGEIESEDRNMIFMNASASYKCRNGMELLLEGSNLTNKQTFSSVEYTDTFLYRYSYNLRPLSLIFKIRFSLR